MGEEWAYDVSLDRFAWCWQARSIENIRHYLQGVWIEPREAGGVYMVGTNGCIMAVAIDEQGTCAEPAIIHLGDDFRRMIDPVTERDPDTDEEKTLWPLHYATRLRFGDIDPGESIVGEARLEGRRSSRSVGVVTRINGVFPDWRNAVINQKHEPISGPVGMIDPKLLKRLAYRDNAVQMFHRSGAAPYKTGNYKLPGTIVLCSQAPWACGFIMPIHRDAWALDGDLARELLGDEEPPLRLSVWS